MRIFLDTNVYIIGTAYPESPEAAILRWIGWGQEQHNPDVEMIVSQELFDQISRVARRLSNKDWAGEILGHIWHDFQLAYVLLQEGDWEMLASARTIPREDIGIYLTAKTGKADIFVSSNHELIHSLAEGTGEFTCLTPDEYLDRLDSVVDTAKK
jgi:predicted nucleic acid-binding protein